MIKAIWMPDPHFMAKGNVLGHDPRRRLQAAIDHINQYHSDAAFCVISGDMVNRGTRLDYASLKDVLGSLKIPFLPMVGNHDDRSIFRSILPVPQTCMSEFIQYSIPTSDGLFLCLDTQKTGSDAGEFCAERLAWLQNELRNANKTPVYIFMHHPPMLLGLPIQDTENMQDGAAFLDLCTSYDCIKHLFIGHVHRPITGTIRGIPFATMRSILYQAPAPEPDWNWDSFAPSHEAPNLGVLSIENASMTLQYVQFCKYEHGLAE